jgi:phage terminase small subunit
MASKREQAFILYYTGEALFNGAEAARLAGYAENSARITASKLLTKPNVLAAVTARIDELTMKSDEVMVRISEQGRGDLGKFIGLKEKEIAEHPQSRLLKSYEHTISGVGAGREEKIKIELYSAQAALFQLWKHHQIAAGKATENIDVSDAKERLAQLIARQAERGTAPDDSGGDEPG